MIYSRFDALVSDLCAEIDDLRAALEAAERERDEWRDRHSATVQSGIAHGRAMLGGLLQVSLKMAELEAEAAAAGTPHANVS